MNYDNEHDFPDDFDEEEFESDFSDEDFVNEKGIPVIPHAFMMTPEGPTPMSVHKLIDQLSKMQTTLVCELFDGQYLVHILGKFNIRGAEETDHKILLECKENPSYKGERTVNIFEVYEYLDTTNFLNFMISKVFKLTVFGHEGITLQMQISPTKTGTDAKIMIMIDTMVCSDWVYDALNSGDLYSTTNTGIITDIPNNPIMLKYTKTKSLYRPILHYDFAFGANNSGDVDFDIINIQKFYDFILKEYIEDAIKTFYPSYQDIPPYNIIKENLIRIEFICQSSGKLFHLRMLCTPAVIDTDIAGMTTRVESPHRYRYAINQYMVSCESIPNCKLETNTTIPTFPIPIPFIDRVSSSPVSQLVTYANVKRGIINDRGMEFEVISPIGILFALNRVLIDSSGLEGLKDIMRKTYQVYDLPSKITYVESYWKPFDSNILVNLDLTGGIKLRKYYGFINVNKQNSSALNFDDLYVMIDDELNDIFKITKEQYQSGEVRAIPCYENDTIRRYVLIGTYTPPKPTKKRRKLFGWW